MPPGKNFQVITTSNMSATIFAIRAVIKAIDQDVSTTFTPLAHRYVTNSYSKVSAGRETQDEDITYI